MQVFNLNCYNSSGTASKYFVIYLKYIFSIIIYLVEIIYQNVKTKPQI